MRETATETEDETEAPFADLIRALKETYVEATERGDILPVIICLKDSEYQAVVTAPEMDPNLAIKAAMLLVPLLKSDLVVFIADTHFAEIPIPKGVPEEDAIRLARERWPKGSMQRACDEEGLCDTGEITDAILVCRVASDGKVWLDRMPYHYHGRGTTFRWAPTLATCAGAEGYCGDIPNKIRRAFKPNAFEDMVAFLAGSAAGYGEPGRNDFVIARHAFLFLQARGFEVEDFISDKHPEWIT